MACTFQSTFPLQGTTDVVSKSSDSGKFQSTFPLQGTTHSIATQRSVRFISIHVPIAGNDEKSINYHHTFFYFNPRSHCRERRQMKAKTESLRRDFNPRSHCRERHYYKSPAFIAVKISIHVPIAGNDRRSFRCTLRFGISIHVPIAGNDGEWQEISPYCHISIHVPIAGNDTTTPVIYSAGFKFQSTFPLQGTTANLSNF